MGSQVSCLVLVNKKYIFLIVNQVKLATKADCGFSIVLMVANKGLYFKTFFTVNVAERVFAAVIHFHPSLIYVGEAGVYQRGASYGTPPQ